MLTEKWVLALKNDSECAKHSLTNNSHKAEGNMKVKLVTLVVGDQKAPFLIATTPRCWGGRYSIPWIALLYPYLIMLSVKQGGIKYQFLSFWYDSTWDWTPVSRTTGEHFHTFRKNISFIEDLNFCHHVYILQQKLLHQGPLLMVLV